MTILMLCWLVLQQMSRDENEQQKLTSSLIRRSQRMTSRDTWAVYSRETIYQYTVMFWQWLEQILVSTYLNNRFDRMMIRTSWWQWAALMVSRWSTVLTSSRTDWRDRWCWCDTVTISFNCNCKLVLILRLGYLKPFLAGSKKTRQGPGLRVGALFISRCWFRLTVVAESQLI